MKIWVVGPGEGSAAKLPPSEPSRRAGRSQRRRRKRNSRCGDGYMASTNLLHRTNASRRGDDRSRSGPRRAWEGGKSLSCPALERVLPNSLDAEMAVLGAMLLQPDRSRVAGPRAAERRAFLLCRPPGDFSRDRRVAGRAAGGRSRHADAAAAGQEPARGSRRPGLPGRFGDARADRRQRRALHRHRLGETTSAPTDRRGARHHCPVVRAAGRRQSAGWTRSSSRFSISPRRRPTTGAQAGRNDLSRMRWRASSGCTRNGAK